MTIESSNVTVASMTPEQQRELLAKLLRKKTEQAKSFPMSEGQQGLWHAFRRDPRATAFNVFLPTRIRSKINLNALRQSIELIVKRHSSLRTTFSDASGKLTQHINDGLKPDFEVVGLPGADDELARQVVSQSVFRPFDLELGPLLRMTAYKLADDDWIVVALTHHIIVDFWSLVLILGEMRSAYSSFADGREPKLPAAPNNYSQFVQQQATLLDSHDGLRLKDYWKGVLEGVSPVVDMPTDRIRPAQFESRASVCALSFPPSIVPRINEFAARNRATPFAVVNSALQVLISRYSGQQSFIIGCPFSGRSHQKFEKTVGFFVNMLPLKADLDGDPSFSQLVDRTAATLLLTLEHEAYPISRIVHDSAIPRDPSRSPLFQVSCTFEKSHVREEVGRAGTLFPGEVQVWDFAGMRQESFYVPHPTCHYDLEFIFEQTATELRGMICYNQSLFDEQTVTHISRNLVSLLDSLLQDGDLAVSRVPWKDTDCTTALQGRRPDLTTALKVRRTVDALILSASSPNCAMQFGSTTLTYQAFDEQSKRLAIALTARGVTRETIVPVVATRGPAAFVAMQAIHRAGAACVPIDVDQPAVDLSTLITDTNPPLIVWDGTDTLPKNLSTHNLSDINKSVPIVQIESLLLDPLGDHASSTSERDTLGSASPSDLAYVVYTSGSTGKPKGVLVDHAAVCNTLLWRIRDVKLETSDRVLMLLSHQFDAGLGIAWTTLTQGASLVWATTETRDDPNRLVEQILTDRITVLPAVPSLLRILIAHPRFSECKNLRYIWTGGEAMPVDLPQQVRSVCTAKFWNFYGPTEAAIEATGCEVTDHAPQRPVPIGRAIANTEIFILDEQHRVVPDTVPGELAIAGAGLARGYLNAPDLTAKKFVPHPVDQSGESRIYLTGDRGRKNANGEFEFLGRTDHQVKLRGYRIELGEIESILESHPLVDRAAVKLVRDSAEAQLLAFVSLRNLSTKTTATTSVPAGGSGLGESCDYTAAIRHFLSERLPAYKLPSALMIVDAMPMVSSGKVDRARLPEAVPPELLGHKRIAPTTPLEVYLADMWCESLGIDVVSVDQNFFDAGGSSLQAAMLTSKLSADLKVNIPTALLFDLADILQVASRLVELHPGVMVDRFGATCIEQQLQKSASSTRSSALPHPLIAPLKPSGSRPPIFMVHPPGGIVVCYHELANHLGAEQPLFGIRSRGLHGHEQLPSTLEEMAAEYIVAAKSVQPAGPYTLGGWSLGGLIAYEMVQQLLTAGETVARLLLLDTAIPDGATDLAPVSEQVNVGLEYGIELTLDQLGELAPEDQLPFLWEHAKKIGVLNDDTSPEVVAKSLEDLQGIFHHHVELARGYRLEPLAIPITLFRPTDVPFELQVTDDRGWGHLARDVTVHFVPGHHHSMVQPPHVHELARHM